MFETAWNKMCGVIRVQEISCRRKDGAGESCALAPRKEQPAQWKLLRVYLTTVRSYHVKGILIFSSEFEDSH